MNNSSDEIDRSSQLDETTGELSYRYSCGGQDCKAEYLESKVANQYIGYDLILHDLTCAKKWMDRAYQIVDDHSVDRPKSDGDCDVFLPSLTTDEHDLLIALFISSVTYFGKCFTKAEGRRVKLERTGIDQDFRTKHNKIMEFRHKIAAHSGDGPWDDGNLAKIIHPTTGEIVVWSELKVLQFYDDRDDQYSYRNLLCLLIAKMNEKLPKIRKAILQNET